MNKKVQTAVVLLSGGMDSATVLVMAKKKYPRCVALTFDYGQRHHSEIAAARRVAAAQGVTEHWVLPLPLEQLGGSALTDMNIPVADDSNQNEAIPATYVPARNTIFLSMALGLAEVVQAQAIFIGASSVDYSGYPDCRPEYFEAFSKLAVLATKQGVSGESISIETPLLHLSKAQTILAGIELGLDYRSTVTCYRADEQGRACGHCASCKLRQKGFADLNIEDQTNYY